jgi:hypothetical protein
LLWWSATSRTLFVSDDLAIGTACSLIVHSFFFRSFIRRVRDGVGHVGYQLRVRDLTLMLQEPPACQPNVCLRPSRAVWRICFAPRVLPLSTLRLAFAARFMHDTHDLWWCVCAYAVSARWENGIIYNFTGREFVCVFRDWEGGGGGGARVFGGAYRRTAHYHITTPTPPPPTTNNSSNNNNNDVPAATTTQRYFGHIWKRSLGPVDYLEFWEVSASDLTYHIDEMRSAIEGFLPE